MAVKKQQVTLYLDEKIIGRIKRVAAAERRSASAQVEMILVGWLINGPTEPLRKRKEK